MNRFCTQLRNIDKITPHFSDELQAILISNAEVNYISFLNANGFGDGASSLRGVEASCMAWSSVR
jgi:hypothetical protein